MPQKWFQTYKTNNKGAAAGLEGAIFPMCGSCAEVESILEKGYCNNSWKGGMYIYQVTVFLVYQITVSPVQLQDPSLCTLAATRLTFAAGKRNLNHEKPKGSGRDE